MFPRPGYVLILNLNQWGNIREFLKNKDRVLTAKVLVNLCIGILIFENELATANSSKDLLDVNRWV